MSNLVNGYNVTGNHGTGSERKYHVCDAAGKVLHRADGIGPAFAIAEKLSPGDIAEAVAEPETDLNPGGKDVEAAKTPGGDVEPDAWNDGAPKETT
ncbi:hypothetical protein LCGC14_1141500 [marine sediment metagenome]|uniref:Uncharacterized protein n=1 Tax=marine sediment metagenome TaxID=412755 RepID=A0A0F9Q3V4_9ZZZZ